LADKNRVTLSVIAPGDTNLVTPLAMSAHPTAKIVATQMKTQAI